MEFRNLTPYPAMAFDALDQQEQRFHVVVMRLTFELQPDGQLLLAPEQTPLVTSDEYYGEVNRSSVRQESDLAPYKPHTDVIVIADAHAPGGAAASEFDVALTINGAAVEPDFPPEPYGLNPLQPASPERMAQWRQECARLTEQARQGPLILAKTLSVTGPREWRKRSAFLRALTLFALPAWKLTVPQPITTLPLRYEYAYGGENKILETEPAAARVSKKHRLPNRKPLPEPATDGDTPQAIAHAVCEHNPVGRGFAEDWYLHATNITRVPAPQIQAANEPMARFGDACIPDGFGIVGRAWQPRLNLAGTYDQQWQDSRHPQLPTDFNFAYWNGAPADQQVIPHLEGDETITLSNLCPAGAATAQDASGNTLLSLALPGHLPFVLVRFEDGRMGELAAKLDTVIVDVAPTPNAPEKKPTVVCVWRATVASAPAVRVLEARMLSRAEVDALRERAQDPESAHPATQPNAAIPPTV
ncbi:hypothetical protein J2S30_001501 [Herbaspirillum rubrisubalbicans]|uniref:DUF2169 family type VI secretion system accessory protein n=1 Tax=Herbaspirillum rubrisubalbicans TaxID=80842 RepID=UPI00209CFD95|nr:DUF2169 domain-containing protein [Herbaspirillum rubrisubalbicans]MCP1573122.1 hypothetical protein [Herbaspirillum rubrisubalbicans]